MPVWVQVYQNSKPGTELEPEEHGSLLVADGTARNRAAFRAVLVRLWDTYQLWHRFSHPTCR